MRKLVEHKGSLCLNGSFRPRDLVTASQFSKNGQFLAVGDAFGRVVAFSCEDQGILSFACQTRAYQETHDWENKTEVEPAVKSLEWMHSQGSRTGLISAGTREIKLWKMTENSHRTIFHRSGPIPMVAESNESKYSLTVTKQLPRLHTSPIKGLNLSSTEDYLLSFDATRILKWNLEYPTTPYVQFSGINKSQPARKSSRMVDENEISDEVEEFEAAEWADYDLITCAKFHGRSDNRIAYSTKHGEIFYIDMRISNNPKPSIVVGNEAPNNYIRRYLNSISEFAFLNDEYRVVSRDYLDTKVWDLRFPKCSIQKYSVFPSINSKILELYQDNRLDEQFKLSVNQQGTKVVTSHFDSSFHEINLITDQNIRYQVNPDNTGSAEPIKGISQLTRLNADTKTNSVCYNPLTEDVCSTVRGALFLFQKEEDSSLLL